MDTLAKPSLTLRRRLKVPPAKVYAAWTDATQLARWFGPATVTVVSAEADARVGGRYEILARTTEGEEHCVRGVYREVVPNQKLVFTWAWRSTPERESLVTVGLKADGDGTWLTLTHEQFFDDEARQRHEHGWTGTFDKLEAYFNG